MTSIQRVFLSCASPDLHVYRERVRDIILQLGAFPILNDESYSAGHNLLQYSYNKIQDADVFVGLYGDCLSETPDSRTLYQRADHTTASGDGQTTLSQWEYQWAIERELPILLFWVSETDEKGQPFSNPCQDLLDKEDKARLLAFKNILTNKHRVRFFSSPDHLAQQASSELTPLLKSRSLFAQNYKGYQLREVIGSGAFGMVYRAQQVSIEREVAVKLILPEHTNQPDFIRSFETEAQLIARLEHPYIVPLFDYWRDGDGAFLVMRYMRGGSLTRHIKGQPLSLEDILRWTEQIGSALAFAHRNGVIHRDLKPDNFLLDDEGNAYLSDFGIARTTGWSSTENAIGGTMAYISPDQLKGEPPTPQADLYSLGIVLYELLTGTHPFAGQPSSQLVMSHIGTPLPDLAITLPHLPISVQIVIERATAKDPAERYADVPSMLEAFRQAIVPLLSPRAAARPEKRPLEVDLINPYKGLRAFQEYDAGDFFGRDALVESLLERMGQTSNDRMLAVIGPSGSGKSSVVKAGLLPALRRGALDASHQWFITEMVPGAEPFQQLEAALLRVAINPPVDLLEALEADEQGLLRILNRILPADETELLLVIDQFEELFTLNHDEGMRSRFLNSFLTALDAPQSRLRLVLTLRADFYDRPLYYLEFGARLRKGLETVLPLSTAELEQSIVRPAEQAGAVLEKGLVTAILQEVGDQPGILPLLQYAMTELFESCKGLMLTFDAYKAMGGVTGALGKRAETLYAELDPSGQETARQVFLRLITLGEGIEDTRRRVRQSEFDSSALPVIRHFGEARLLTFDRDPQTREPTVEVAHEALLRTWQRLKDWVAAVRTDLAVQRRLSHATQEWLNAGQDSGFLAQEAPLEQFENWSQTTTLTLNAMEQAFLDASLAERTRRQTLEVARKAHEVQTVRRAQNLGRAAAVFALTGLMAIILTAVAFVRTNQAEERSAAVNTEVSYANATLTPIPITLTALADQANVNESRRLGALADAEMRKANGSVMAAALLSIRGLKRAYTVEADEALQRSTLLLEIPRLFSKHSEIVVSVAFSPDGTKVLTGSQDDTAILWDAATGQSLMVFSGHKGDVRSVAFSPDGTKVLTGSVDTNAILWEAATGQPLIIFSGHTDAVVSVVFSADGHQVLTGSDDWMGRLWDAESGQPLMSFPAPQDNTSVALFSPDNRQVMIGGWNQVAEFWDIASGQQIRSIDLRTHSNTAISLAISPDGTKLLTGSLDKTAVLWDLETGQRLLVFSGHTDTVSSVKFSPDGSQVLTGSWDGTVALWDVVTGQRLKVFSGHTRRINSVAFSPDGTQILTGSDDMTAMLWDMKSQTVTHVLDDGHTSLVLSVAYSPDGTTVLTGDLDNKITLSDATTGQTLKVFSGHTESVNKVTFNADGSWFLSASLDKRVILWDVASGEQIQVFSGHGDSVTSAVFSPDETQVLTSSWDGTAVLWDVATGEQLKIFDADAGSVWGAVFSPDGRKILTSYWTHIAILWDLTTGEQLDTFSGHTEAIWGIAFSPDGSKVLTGSWDSTAVLWDVNTGQQMAVFTGHEDTVNSVAFSADGTQILTGSWDDTARLWDAATGRQLKVFYGHTDNVTSVAFSPDGSKVLAGSNDKTVFWWYIDENKQMAELCGRLLRDFTSSERVRYRLPDENATCPQFADSDHPEEPLPPTATSLPITLPASTALPTPTPPPATPVAPSDKERPAPGTPIAPAEATDDAASSIATEEYLSDEELEKADFCAISLKPEAGSMPIYTEPNPTSPTRKFLTEANMARMVGVDESGLWLELMTPDEERGYILYYDVVEGRLRKNSKCASAQSSTE